MKVSLDDLSLMVKLDGGDIVFHIDMPRGTKKFWAEPQSPIAMYPGLVKQLGDVKKIPLGSRDILAANDELRKLLRKKGRQVLDTTFWYDLVEPADDMIFTVSELDPRSHKTISIGSFTGSLSSNNDTRSTAFLKKIRQSSFCVSAQWNHFNEITVTLHPEAAKASNRLQTYKALLELF